MSYKVDLEEMKRLYYTENKSTKEISEYFNVHHSTINRLVRSHNLEINPKSKKYGKDKPPLTTLQKDLIRGTLMGDGYVSFPAKRSTTASLEVSHSIKQNDYFQWKVEILQNIITKIDERKVGKTWIVDHWSSGCHSRRLRTISHPELNDFVYEFYKDGRKTFDLELLNKLNPFSLAVWFMDDGIAFSSKKKAIALGSINTEEQEVFSKWFNSNGFYGRIHLDKTCFMFIFTKEGASNFVNTIKPHIHESMMYKINRIL